MIYLIGVVVAMLAMLIFICICTKGASFGWPEINMVVFCGAMSWVGFCILVAGVCYGTYDFWREERKQAQP